MTLQRFQLAAAAVTVSAGLAAAQSSGTMDFYRPLTAAQAQPATKSHVKVMMSQADGDDSYEITIDGDKITAKVNGKDVPSDRVRRSGDTIEILNKGGDVVSTFHTAQPSGNFGWTTNPSVGSGATLSYMLGNPGSAAWSVAAPDQNPPNVMLGVTMVAPSEIMAEQLQLEPDTGVQLDRVVSGLGADKAGLKKGDVLVSFDGIKPITVAKVRESLAKKSPGDKVQVAYLRKGEEKTTTLELQKYDASRLENVVAARTAPRALAATLDDAQKAHVEAEKAMDEALRARVLTLRGAQGGQGGNGIVFGPSGDPFQVYTSRLGEATPEAKEKMAEMQKKISELDEKLTRLNTTLDELNKKLDKLNDRK